MLIKIQTIASFRGLLPLTPWSRDVTDVWYTYVLYNSSAVLYLHRSTNKFLSFAVAMVIPAAEIVR
jgi:hypothetical protein